MSKDPRPKDHPAAWLTPYLVVRDTQAALEFYQKAFGFELDGAMPGPGGRPVHVAMHRNEAQIMFSPEGAWGSNAKVPAATGGESPVGLYVYVEDVDAFFKRATEAGAKAIQSPEDMFWGDRVCRLIDPDGHNWSFATNVGEFDPSKAPKFE